MFFLRELIYLGILLIFSLEAKVHTKLIIHPRLPSGVYQHTYKDVTRPYIVHLPKNHEYDNNLPLVIALHGAPGTAANIHDFSGLNAMADKAKFIAVYPNGPSLNVERQPEWNTWNCCSKSNPSVEEDVNYILSLVKTLVREYHINEKRIYAAGFSKGAMMAEFLACHKSGIFAGIADIAGAINFSTCKPKRGVKVIIIHGRDDKNVKFGGDVTYPLPPLKPREDRPVAHTTNVWKKINKCKNKRIIKHAGIEYTHYDCMRKGGGLRVVAIDKEGHTWPGSRSGIIGSNKPTQQINANKEMWSFWTESKRKKTKK
ncbi:MAG: hypothetical protein LDLANPLL_02332 [Turneriella sp.]|nr:hypothetical protein [Turneriella sp.]